MNITVTHLGLIVIAAALCASLTFRTQAAPIMSNKIDQEDARKPAQSDQQIWLDYSRAGDKYTFIPSARLSPGETGRYELTINKSGTSGRSSTRQSGALPSVASTNTKVALAKSAITLKSTDQWNAELIVTLSDGTVHTVSASDRD